jgi:hypothetical protein
MSARPGDVGCPTCGRAPGARCADREGWPLAEPHLMRREAAALAPASWRVPRLGMTGAYAAEVAPSTTA